MSQVIDLSGQTIEMALFNAGDLYRLRMQCVSGATVVELGSNIEFEIVGIDRMITEGKGRVREG